MYVKTWYLLVFSAIGFDLLEKRQKMPTNAVAFVFLTFLVVEKM